MTGAYALREVVWMAKTALRSTAGTGQVGVVDGHQEAGDGEVRDLLSPGRRPPSAERLMDESIGRHRLPQDDLLTLAGTVVASPSVGFQQPVSAGPHPDC